MVMSDRYYVEVPVSNNRLRGPEYAKKAYSGKTVLI